MNINIFLYPIAGLVSLLIMYTFTNSDIALTASGGSYVTAIKLAFMGGFGNTIGALAALICSFLGIVRNVFSSNSGFGAFISGKLIGTVNSVVTLFAVFLNGVLVYLKLSENGQIYITLLGTPIFEITICVVLTLAFFLKPKKKVNL